MNSVVMLPEKSSGVLPTVRICLLIISYLDSLMFYPCISHIVKMKLIVRVSVSAVENHTDLKSNGSAVAVDLETIELN